MKYRVIKFLEKLKINNGKLRLNSELFLDGYHQDLYLYEQFPPNLLIDCIRELKSCFKINDPHKEVVYHFRLGDFFENFEDKINFAKDYLDNVQDGSDIITNEEEIFNDRTIKDTFTQKKLEILDTGTAFDYQVLETMAEYKVIHTNASTVAIWSSILAGSEARFNHQS